MLNIHNIKTVSSLVVYLTFDDFRYDCNDDMFKTSSDDEFGYWLHCFQKKTPTHIFFHITMNNLWI